MGTTADKLTYLSGTKDAIKAALEAKGVTMPPDATFRSYASFIQGLTQDAVTEQGSVPPMSSMTLNADSATTRLALTRVAAGTTVEIDVAAIRGSSTQFTWGGASGGVVVTVAATPTQITVSAGSGTLSALFAGYTVYGA